MPMQTTSQVLYDGYRNVIMQFTGINGDGSSETNVVKVSVADLNPRPLSVKILHIDYDISGGIVQLAWDAPDPVQFVQMQGYGDLEYDRYGGLINGGGDAATGNILLSTLGFDVGSTYTIILEMVKKFP